MSQFCSIQELCSFEGSEASPLVIHPTKNDLTSTEINLKVNDFDSMASSQNPYEEKSPTLDGLVFNCDLDAIVRKTKRDYQEGLFLYKHLKDSAFFKEFKSKYGRDLRTTDALIHLSKVLKYEYYTPKSVIYKKGDLSNQRVYLVYSGEVNAWVGKPDANAVKPSNRIIPETIVESTPKTCSNDFSSSIKSGGFGAQSTKIRRRQNRISHPSKRESIAETPKAVAQTAPKARTLKKQFTFDGIFSHKEGSGLSETNLHSTNSHTMTDDSEGHSREILYAKPPADSRRSVELGSEKSGLGLSNRRLQSKLLSRSITLDIKNIDDKVRFNTEENSDEYGLVTKSSNKEDNEFDFSDRCSTEPNKESHFVLRRVNLQRAHTINLDFLNTGSSLNRNTSEGGYVRHTIRKGGHFGDDILKSSQPREETLVTVTSCELLVLNLEAFEYLMTRFERTNTKILNFVLDHVPGLEEALNQKKLMRPDLYFKEETFQLHNHILVEGNKGKKIYLLFEGTCQVLKSMSGASKNKGPRKPYTCNGDMILCMIQPGVFVGEEVLFNSDGQFEYTIKAASAPVKLLSISVQAFKDSMPKVAYYALESLYTSKKQKNMEIMDTRVEFSKLQQASSPKAADAEIAMQTKIFKTQNESHSTRNFQVVNEPAKNNRFFARPYTVELTVPGGQEGPKVVDGLRFKRHMNQTPEPNVSIGQISISKEKEESKVEVVERLSEGERKLRRYLHQGVIRKSVTPKASNEKLEEFPLVKMKSHEESGSHHRASGNDNGLHKLSIATYGKKEHERCASVRENDGFAAKRRAFEGFSGKRLNQIMAYVSPTREKFAGFVGSVPHLAQRFTQGLQTQRNEDNVAVKVKVNVKTKKVTYGVQSVRNVNQNELKSYDLFNNINVNSAAHIVVKTAAALNNDAWLKSKLSERKTISLRETPERFFTTGDYQVEARLTEKLEGLGRMSRNFKRDENK